MTLFPDNLFGAARSLIDDCMRQGLRIATAESCTGGLVIGCLTEIAGSSAAVDRGFVVYDNEAKRQMLGVTMENLERFGAVSAEVAGEMAHGAIARSMADIAVSITGIAGPGGATPTKPVGLVYFGACRKGRQMSVERRVFPGNRGEVRLASVALALELLQQQLS